MLQKSNKIILNYDKHLEVESLYQDKGFKAVTSNVEVIALPEFSEDSSALLEDMNVWNYNIKITNSNKGVVKLKTRYFKIVDENGEINEVLGEGVIGKQPEILPNEFFEYQSSVNLRANSAIMSGHYLMEFIGGEEFRVEIPGFSLELPINDYIIN